MGLLSGQDERWNSLRGEGVMQRSFAAGGTTPRRFLLIIVLAVLSAAMPTSLTCAAITPTGDVSPSNPSSWTSATTGYIGNTASGTLTVDGGSDLLSSYTYIGYSSTAAGVVNVRGTGSTWTNNGYPTEALYLQVGYYGGGTLSIADGGNVSSSTSEIGNYSGSTGLVSVDGVGSLWALSNPSSLTVGNFGSGTLSITNGGRVSSGTDGASIGGYLTSVVTVNGAGSKWINNGELIVGYYGAATLAITDGGSVSVAGATYVGQAGSTATIQFGANGGTLTTQALFASPTQLAGTGLSTRRDL